MGSMPPGPGEFASRNAVVASPIVGVTKMSHLEEAVAALEVELTAGEKERLEEVYTPRANLF